MGFQEICDDVVQETEGALGCLLIDLNTGLTLAASSRPAAALNGTRIESILRSSDDMFRGKLINRFVKALPTNRESASGFVTEIQTATAYSYQFMAAIPGWDDGIVVVITEKSLSLGLGWMAVRQAQDQIAAARPGKGQEPAGAKPVPAAAPGHDPGLHAQRQPRTPTPPRDSMPAEATTPPPAKSAWDQTSATPLPTQPPMPAEDPEPERPPATEPPSSPSIPHPHVANEGPSIPAEAPPADRQPGVQTESQQRLASGPRANMFKPRKDKKRTDKRPVQ